MWWYSRTHVIVHRAMLSSMWWYSHPHVIVHRAMLSSMWWYSQTHIIVYRAMLLSMWWYSHPHVIVELCYRPCGGILRPMLSSTELCYCPCGYSQTHVVAPRAMLLSTEINFDRLCIFAAEQLLLIPVNHGVHPETLSLNYNLCSFTHTKAIFKSPCDLDFSFL